MLRFAAIALTSLLFVTHASTANAQCRGNRGEAEASGGDSITGSLGHGPMQGQRFVDVRNVRLQAGEQVEIAVSSDDFDTMVRVEGNGLREEDDDGGEGTNSRLHFQAPATGTYRVTVTSYGAGETGSYEMSILRGAAANRAPSRGAQNDDDGSDFEDNSNDEQVVPARAPHPPMQWQPRRNAPGVTAPAQTPPAPAGYRYLFDTRSQQWFLVPAGPSAPPRVAPPVVQHNDDDGFDDGASAQRTPEHAQPTQATVVLYGASWCPACHQAANYLRNNGIPFVQHDIEREPQVARDLERRARQQGVSTNSIPIVEVNGRLMNGFNPSVVQRAMMQGANRF